VEVDDDDEAIGEDGDDGYNPNEMKIKSGVGKGVLDQVLILILENCFIWFCTFTIASLSFI
jgi:hypothetical protein